MAPYDTIQLKVGPSWLDKKCSEFGPPVYPASAHSVRIPVFDLLPQIQLEAVLWGIGTALGELPPYFISRAGEIACHFFHYSDILLYVTLYTISLIAVQKHYRPLYFF